MSVSRKVDKDMTRASWIRRMFEQGEKLKREYGRESVFDFSLGNPILEPPKEVLDVLLDLVSNPPAGLHRYMANAGDLQTRQSIADYLGDVHKTVFSPHDVIMTNGAAGGLNVALKALLDPGDEVVVVSPFFTEYGFYVDNHGGKLVEARSSDDFDLDPDEIERTVGPRTKAVIINSPNNPTGRLYSEQSLLQLARVLERKQSIHGHVITLISDEPYRKIVYDGLEVPSVFSVYPNTILIVSHSKDLGLAGERIGYAAISPTHRNRSELESVMTFVNRTLGFVNAPALFQKVVARCQDASVPVKVYQELRDLFCDILDKAGLEYFRPQGAFYLFPKTPIEDDVKFVNMLLKERLLAVPGSGFGRPGYMRLSFCVTRQEILDASDVLHRVAQSAREGA